MGGVFVASLLAPARVLVKSGEHLCRYDRQVADPHTDRIVYCRPYSRRDAGGRKFADTARANRTRMRVILVDEFAEIDQPNEPGHTLLGI
jgi:hypothetical protein